MGGGSQRDPWGLEGPKWIPVGWRVPKGSWGGGGSQMDPWEKDGGSQKDPWWMEGPKWIPGVWRVPNGSLVDGGSQKDPWSEEGPHLLLLLPGQLHLLLLLLEEHGGHVLLLRVRRQQLVPQRGQLVDHHQQLQLLLCQALLGSWGRKKTRLGEGQGVGKGRELAAQGGVEVVLFKEWNSHFL